MADQMDAVPFRGAAAATVCSYLWTHRLTSCDVISVVTTVEASKGEHSTDFAVEDVTKANKSIVGAFTLGTPLEENAQDRRSRMHHLLHTERDEFMRRLHDKRLRRLAVENAAATKLQCYFRGYRVRAKHADIRHRCDVRKDVRAGLRVKLQAYGIVLSAKQYSQQRSDARNHAAIRIQSSFRRFHAQNTVQRLRPQRQRMRLLAAVTIIQSAFRLWASKNVRAISALENKIESSHLAAIVIQCAVRRHQAIIRVARRRRKLRHTAALIIQCGYRVAVAKRHANQRRSTIESKRRNIGAMQMQRLIRGFLGRRRCHRLRAERIVCACLLLQTWMRQILASRKVAAKRRVFMESRRQSSAIKIQRCARGMICRRRLQDARLLEQCDALACASRGDLRGLQDAVELLDDISSETNPDGDNALIVAARQGHIAIVQQCLEWGFDIDFTNAWGESAIVAAVKAKKDEVAGYLLAKGCNVEDHVDVLLFEAAAGGMSEVLQTMIASGHDVDTICNDMDETPLFGSCQAGEFEASKLLLECGADVHKRNADGQTVLHKAATAANQNIQLLQLLLDLGLDVSSGAEISGLPASHAETGRTPWLCAIIHGRTETLQHLQTVAPFPASTGKIVWTAEDIDAVIALCEADQLQCVKQLLAWGFDHNAQSSTSQDTPILAAARGGAQSVVAELLQRNVHLDAVNSKGRSVLHEAFACDNAEITTELIMRMHNLASQLVGYADQNGITPLHEAAAAGVSVDLLDRTGVEAVVNMRTKCGMTPLMVACLYKQFHVAQSLIACGADVEAAEQWGRVALHYCYARRPTDSLRKLVNSRHRRLLFAETSDALPALASPEHDEAASSATRNAVIISCVSNPAILTESKQPVLRFMEDWGDAGVLAKVMEVSPPQQAWEILLTAIRSDLERIVRQVLENVSLQAKLASVADARNETVQRPIPDDSDRAIESIIYRGKSIAGWAVETQSVAVLKLLLQRKANIHTVAVDSSGNTLLHLACAKGSTRILDILLADKVFNLESTNKAGLTPLGVAVQHGQEAAARSLIKRGANIQAGLDIRLEAWMLARNRSPAVLRFEEADLLLWYLYEDSRKDCTMFFSQ